MTTFFLCWSAYGAERHAASKTPPEEIQFSSQIQKQSLNEVDLLKEQNKLIREYQASILSTVYWALSGVFTVLAFLAGFGWWSNFKMYEADKVRLQQDLDSKINELDSKLALRLEENRTELERAVDVKGEAQLSRLLSELTDVRANISKLSDESRQRSDEIKEVQEELKKNFSQLLKFIRLTEGETRFVEEQVWELKGIPNNILMTQCQAIDAALAAENLDAVNNVLGRLQRTLQKYYITEQEKLLDKTLYDKIHDRLNKLGDKNAILAKEILELLGKIQVVN